MQMNVKEDPVSMHILAKTSLGIIDASARRAGLVKTVTIISTTVWGNANMELLALIWSMTITVPVSLDTLVNITCRSARLV
jgi:hypothetical protein